MATKMKKTTQRNTKKKRINDSLQWISLAFGPFHLMANQHVLVTGLVVYWWTESFISGGRYIRLKFLYSIYSIAEE